GFHSEEGLYLSGMLCSTPYADRFSHCFLGHGHTGCPVAGKRGSRGRRVTGPASGGGNRGSRSECRTCRRCETPTGRRRRRCPSRPPASRSRSPRTGLRDPLQCHSHTPLASPAPTPPHCHTCRRVPRHWAAAVRQDASALQHSRYTTHSVRVGSAPPQSSRGWSSRRAPRTPTPPRSAGG